MMHQKGLKMLHTMCCAREARMYKHLAHQHAKRCDRCLQPTDTDSQSSNSKTDSASSNSQEGW